MVLVLGLPGCCHAATPCSDLLPSAVGAVKPEREITPADLVRLRQIGPMLPMRNETSALALSPDGQRLAFVITRPDPATNTHCLGLAVMELRQASSSSPRLVDAGGQLILGSQEYRGQVWSIGYPRVITPRWSPDGRSIAWLRRDRNVTQVWVVTAGMDTSASEKARQVTFSGTDVDEVAWLPDGKGLVFASRSGSAREKAELAAEGRRGFHYDDRFVPIMSYKPMPSAAIPWSTYRVELGDLAVRPATPEEAALLPPDMLGKMPAPPGARGRDGALALTRRSTANPFSPLILTASTRAGKMVTCQAATCRGGFDNVWWSSEGRAVVFLRKEGWAEGDTALYSWVPGTAKPVSLLRTRDLVSNCVMASASLVCLQETATTPPRLVAVDPRTGGMEVLFDPNPEFGAIRFGTVQRLEWQNEEGDEVRGDLVLPPGYTPGKRIPLLVTSYLSNGFLRGAMGDEYPIHAFAAAGIAVLSYNQPLIRNLADPKLDTVAKVQSDGTRSWSRRHAVQSAVMTGIDRVIALGIADPDRIGISGLSDGSSTVQFALIHTRRFAAAAMSTCCLEPWAVNVGYGPAFARLLQGQGWGRLTANDTAFWKEGSLIQNASAIDTPLLMQLADHEYLGGVDVFAALKEQGKPVDLYVFPDAFHWKYQPAQRLAVYQRNLDWFSFWLRDRIDPDPAKAGQYAVWQALKAHRAQSR
ncbi:Atxe2 family lasso peptide isopeptidase [Novosphingobium gossypii]|uniref:Atxe2 family lasso peptide isopeptidase n=1 Tax=Novosphingobium gossypii TaxID=1604774 RepID=UPI003D232F38